MFMICFLDDFIMTLVDDSNDDLPLEWNDMNL